MTPEIESLRKKLASNPQSLVFVALADAYRRAGMLDDAIATCEGGLVHHPRHMSAHVVLGKAHFEKKQYDRAANQFRQVLENDPENLVGHTTMAQIQSALGNVAEAIREYEVAVALSPADESLVAALGDLRRVEANSPVSIPPAAMAAAVSAGTDRTAAKVPPTVPAPAGAPRERDELATLTVADIYVKQGFLQEAIEIYQKILAVDPSNQEAQSRLEQVFQQQDAAKPAPQAPAVVVLDEAEPVITVEDALSVFKDFGSVAVSTPETRPIAPPQIEPLLPEKVPAGVGAESASQAPAPTPLQPKRPAWEGIGAFPDPPSEEFEALFREIIEREKREASPRETAAQIASEPATEPPLPETAVSRALGVAPKPELSTTPATAEVAGVGSTPASVLPAKEPAGLFESQISLADLYVVQGYFDEAIEVFQRILADAPDREDVRKRLEEAYRQKEDREQNPVIRPASTAVPSPFRLEDEILSASDTVIEEIDDSSGSSPRHAVTSTPTDQVRVGNPPSSSRQESEPVPSPEATLSPPTNVVPAPVISQAPPAPEPPPVTSPSGSGSRVPMAEWTALLQAFVENNGVSSVLLASADGSALAYAGHNKTEWKSLASASAAIFDGTGRVTNRLQQGALVRVSLVSKDHQIFLTGSKPGVVVVTADATIKIGFLRIAMNDLVQKLSSGRE